MAVPLEFGAPSFLLIHFDSDLQTSGSKSYLFIFDPGSIHRYTCHCAFKLSPRGQPYVANLTHVRLTEEQSMQIQALLYIIHATMESELGLISQPLVFVCKCQHIPCLLLDRGAPARSVQTNHSSKNPHISTPPTH